jgi:hypothetical protein
MQSFRQEAPRWHCRFWRGRLGIFNSTPEASVIADYGSSQGKNSLAPLRLAIKTLRARLGPDRPILTYHIDQPSNDFNSLFEVLDADADRYVLDEPNVFPSAIGRSFYSQVRPSDYVHLGWSSYAAVWLSRVPGPIPGHFIAFAAKGAPLAEFAVQAARDWERSSPSGRSNCGRGAAWWSCSRPSMSVEQWGSKALWTMPMKCWRRWSMKA